MVEVEWTDGALYDLDEIGEFIAQDSPFYADQYTDKLFDKPRILVKHPKYGHPVPELGVENIRQLIEGNYRIIYEILNEDQIDVLLVQNSNRLLKNHPRYATLKK